MAIKPVDQVIQPLPVSPPAGALPADLPEPQAGGSYLRDPVTGALTLNNPLKE